VIDVIFDLIGAFATLGSFVIKIAGSVIGAIEGMVNGFIKIINGVISAANKIPGIEIGKVGEVNIPRPSLGVAPPAPVRTPTVPSGVTDSFQRSIAPIGLPSFTPGVDEGPEDDDEEEGGKRGGRGGTVGILPVDMEGQIPIRGGIPGGFGGGGGIGAAPGNVAVLDGLTGGPTVVNVTINTVSADANLPTLVVEALQKYNLVNGPIDVSIAI
jgi:hypothetical protein